MFVEHISQTIFWCSGQQGIWQLVHRIFTFLSKQHGHSWQHSFLLDSRIPDPIVAACKFRVSIPNDLRERRTPYCSVCMFWSLLWMRSFTSSLPKSFRNKRRRWRFPDSQSEYFKIQIMYPATAAQSSMLNQKTTGQRRIFRLQVCTICINGQSCQLQILFHCNE